jgi:Raf kinase inhibitor-like YbhB/YbcL family protein
MGLKLTSKTFKDGDYLGADQVMSANLGFGCAGGNMSPHLRWEGAPAGTKGFAVTCFDPDAPTGSGFWHWVVINIPANVHELPAGAGNPANAMLPAGAMQIRSDAGNPGYAGPCSPEGDHPHRYLFTIRALSTETLPVTPDSPAALVGFHLHFTTIEETSLMGLYKR